MQKLIILRGNSGSGKTTVAKRLREKMGYEVMLISQDTVRREMLRTKDTEGNPSIQLIYDLALYGKRIGYDVIIEGIMYSSKGGDMLKRLLDDFGGDHHVYYFDISFDETLRRHETKDNKHEFNEDDMRRWWREKDYLNVPHEKIITEDMSLDQIVNQIYTEVRS